MPLWPRRSPRGRSRTDAASDRHIPGLREASGDKDAARKLWSYATHAWAVKGWKRWITRALRSKLEPIEHVARTIRDQPWGIVNAVVLGVTNAGSESQNAKIQWIKKQACGFRNRERFRNAIYFHLGGLDLYPRT